MLWLVGLRWTHTASFASINEVHVLVGQIAQYVLSCSNQYFLLCLQAEIDAAAAAAALSIEERDGIIDGLRASLAEYVIELKALTDMKLALDAEIATYRRLLAGEETR